MYDLGADDYWQEAGSTPAVGDAFARVRLLSIDHHPIRQPDKDGNWRTYLPTASAPALFIKMFHRAWWFAPLLTAEFFDDPDLFSRTWQMAAEEAIPGWLALPPLVESSGLLAAPLLVPLHRPTVHQPSIFRARPTRRLARLTESAIERLHDEFIRGIAETS